MMDQIKSIYPYKTRRTHPRLRILPLWSRLTRRPHYWEVEILRKLVACGISNMISAHPNSMNSSSKQNSKATLLWNSRTSTTTSRCVSICCLDSEKTFLLLSSASKDNLSLKNTSSQIVITLPIIGIIIPTITLDTHCLWYLLVTNV